MAMYIKKGSISFGKGLLTKSYYGIECNDIMCWLLFFLLQGTFRLACEHVLKTLKKGRETLLTLLEAFVYDPLVDWAVAEDTAIGGGANEATSSNRHRQQMANEKDRHNITVALGATEMAFGIETARKQMQDEFTRDTLIIQTTELKPEWIQNRSVFHVIFTGYPLICINIY